MSVRRAMQRGDAGVTLTEMVATVLLLALVTGLAATLFIQLINTQREIQLVADANNTNQLVFSQFERDLRNAKQARVADNGNLLVVMTRTATATSVDLWRCVGYYFDESTGTVHRVSSAGLTETQSAVTAGSAAALRAIGSQWPVELTGAQRLDDAPVFGPLDATFEAPKSVDIAISAATARDRSPVEFTKTISLRPQSGAGGGCY